MKESGEGQFDRNPEKRESEKERVVPIIDVVRHGSTDYKELQDPNFKFDPQSPDFKLDPEHLDLNEQGIKEIKLAAEQLAGVIDKDNEVVVLMTSPQFRAQSSCMVLEKKLREKGIQVVAANAVSHPGRTIKKVSSLHQITLRDDVDKTTWIKKHQALIKERPREFKDVAPDEAHSKVARELGGALGDWFQEDYGDIEQRFQNFLRHMTSIGNYLSQETRNSLAGKKLRIISVAHEELPVRFLKKNIGPEATLKNGQIMEFRPHQLPTESGDFTAKVTLYPKDHADSQKVADVKLNFKPKKP